MKQDYRHYKLDPDIDWDGIAIVAITLVGFCLLYLLGAYWDVVSGAFK